MVKPKMIIAFGNTAMWALTGIWGVTKWRGSMLYADALITDREGTRCVPTFHPAMILRQWEFRAPAIHDLKRAAEYVRKPYPDPGWWFRVKPSFSEALETLERLYRLAEERKAAESEAEPSEALSPEEEKRRAERAGAAGPAYEIELSFDLETRAGHISCAGISWTLQDAISIPFMCAERGEGYWTADEEAQVIWMIRRLLTHPNVVTVGQNLLYDCQYTWRYWYFVPRKVKDTMISHHVAYPGLPKRLDFLASMYCNYYKQWKPDRGEWKAGG